VHHKQPEPWVIRGTRQSVADLVGVIFSTLRPPSTEPVADWVEANRELTNDTSAEAGPYDVGRIEPQREPLNAIGDEMVREITLMWASQLGKTEIKLSGILWGIDQDPCPMIDLEPTQDDARNMSKERIAPAIRNCKALRGKVRDARSRDSENTLTTKRFPGGHLAITASHSPAGLCSRPRRFIFEEECDRYPESAGAEGDPCALVEKRASTFWNRKVIRTSSPTVKGASRIERYFEAGTQERFRVPCPHCGASHWLKWHRVRWSKLEDGTPDFASVRYECEACDVAWTEEQKNEAVRHGSWVAAYPEHRSHRSFQLSSLYSPLVTLEELVREWYSSQGDTELIKVFVNTRLAETFEELGEKVSDLPLFERTEEYNALEELPAGVAVITAAVDTQDDRLEIEIKGWGRGRESWSLEYLTLQGDTSDTVGTPRKPSVWQQARTMLESRRYRHPCGAKLQIGAVAIDSGGHSTDAVYQVAMSPWAMRCFAVKGHNLPGAPIWPGRKGQTGNKARCPVFMVGVNTAKDQAFADLQKQIPGPGYVHHPAAYTRDYFAQLGSEERVQRIRAGQSYTLWVKRAGARNEAWDLHVYNLAVLEGLHLDLDALADDLGAPVANTDAVAGQPARRQPSPAQHQPFTARPRRVVRRRLF
jgi:phage terminase large subunit GpA-like protein